MLFAGAMLGQEKVNKFNDNKYMKKNIIHVDYDSLKFSNYSLNPISKEKEMYLAGYNLESEIDGISVSNKTLEDLFEDARDMQNGTRAKFYLNDAYIFLDDKFRNHKKVKKFNLRLLKKLRDNSGLTNKDLYNLTIRESLDLSFDTAKKMIKYKEVDRGKYVVDGINYNALPFDKKIKTGVGDCNVYTSLASHLFTNLKNKNKKLENIYLGHSYYSRMNNHDWNQIYFTDGDRLYISSVDVTIDKDKNAIDNTDNFYISEHKDENLMIFYHNFSGRITSNKWNEKFLDVYKKTKERINSNGFSPRFLQESAMYFNKFKDELK